MVRGNQYSRYSINRIDSRRKNFQAHALHLRHVKAHARALRLANPVALLNQHALRPAACQFADTFKQRVGILGDAQEPLLDFFGFHRRGVVLPAKTVDYLLVRQHRLALRAPVHAAAPPVGQSFFKHPQKEPLVPAVIFRFAGGNFAVPVVAEAETLAHRLHLRDVRVGPFTRRRAALDCGVLSGQSESIPPNGMQHVESTHALVTRYRIADGVVAHVAHVQCPGGIRQHFEKVILGAGTVVIFSVERVLFLPYFLPLRFYCLGIVLCHSFAPASSRAGGPQL